MGEVNSHLEALIPHLGTVAESCEKFATSAQSFVALRSTHRRTLTNHALLLEVSFPFCHALILLFSINRQK